MINKVLEKQLDDTQELFDNTMSLWSDLDVTALTAMSVLPMLIDFVAYANDEDRTELMARMSEAVILMGKSSKKSRTIN